MAERERQRIAQSFESYDEAKMRTESRKRSHDHVGQWSSYSINWCDVLNEVETYPDDKIFNFTDIGKRYQLQNSSGDFPQNGGLSLLCIL